MKMKTKAQIAYQIRQLTKIAENNTGHAAVVAYEAYHALRWVVEDVDWTPERVVNKYLPDNQRTVK